MCRFLFSLPSLASMVMVFAMLIALIIAVMLPPPRRQLDALNAAEGSRQALLIETIHGMHTVKALAIEPYATSDVGSAIGPDYYIALSCVQDRVDRKRIDGVSWQASAHLDNCDWCAGRI